MDVQDANTVCKENKEEINHTKENGKENVVRNLSNNVEEGIVLYVEYMHQWLINRD